MDLQPGRDRYLDAAGRGIDLKANLSIYNLLNTQEVINVAARYEGQPGVMRDTFGTGTRWQSPRYAQLVVNWNF